MVFCRVLGGSGSDAQKIASDVKISRSPKHSPALLPSQSSGSQNKEGSAAQTRRGCGFGRVAHCRSSPKGTVGLIRTVAIMIVARRKPRKPAHRRSWQCTTLHETGGPRSALNSLHLPAWHRAGKCTGLAQLRNSLVGPVATTSSLCNSSCHSEPWEYVVLSTYFGVGIR